MRPIADIDPASLDLVTPDISTSATALLNMSEEIVKHWIAARGQNPTDESREGFRLLALHRQGAKGDPSFNACRETCREIVYHYNLVTLQPDDTEAANRLEMMRMVASHLYLFISGKMQVAELGDFCCSSKPIRLNADVESRITGEG